MRFCDLSILAVHRYNRKKNKKKKRKKRIIKPNEKEQHNVKHVKRKRTTNV